jgi:site-specific DNA-methyltransferase (adenine-specific)
VQGYSGGIVDGAAKTLVGAIPGLFVVAHVEGQPRRHGVGVAHLPRVGDGLGQFHPLLDDRRSLLDAAGVGRMAHERIEGRRDTITKEEFLEFTKSVWGFAAESARKVGHPAPFPVELPYRLIQLYTFEGEVVLDPFMGSGQTAIAALKAGRHYVGYEINPDYVRHAEQRIAEKV